VAAMSGKVVFLGLVGGALAYEVWAIANKKRGDTISEIVWTATARRPLLPFALGMVAGHFFWQRVPDESGDL
jgi:hypothetical protein